MADLTLSYADQLTAIYERRFPSSAPAAQWLAAAYTDVWASENWTFKRVSLAALYTSADGNSNGTPSATPLMPTAFGTLVDVFDDQGCELRWVEPHDFDRMTAADTTTGRPDTFTVVGRQVRLWPTPTSAYAFNLSYKRRLCTRASDGTVQAGFYQAATDIPMWDDHHYLLVLRAKIIGLRDRSDPTAADLDGEYMRLLEAMKLDYAESLPRGKQLPAWRP